MSNEFTLDADSPDVKASSKFDLAQEENEGASLLEAERNRQQLLADEESENSMPQNSSGQGSNRLGNEGQDYSNGVEPIKEEKESNLDPASSMQITGAQQQPATQNLEQDDEEEEDDDYEDDAEEDDEEEEEQAVQANEEATGRVSITD